MHGHPPHALFDPLVEAKLSERVLLSRILPGRGAGLADFLNRNRDPQARISLMPHVLVGPVILSVSTVDDRVERRVMFLACEDVFSFLMLLITNRMRVGTGRRDEEVQRLRASITRTLGHHVEQGTARLGVEFVEDDTRNVEPVLRIRLSAQHLIEGVGGLVNNPLLRGKNLDTLGQRWTHADHVRRDLKHNRGLLAVCRAPIHFSAFFTIPAGEQERDRCGKLRLAHLLRNLDIGGGELAVTVRFDGAEQVTDDLLLPINELERFA
ncbi:Uncharacterised protein [Chlamydia trachomatis]|nr:Uncharacterised protein [Chlamydia trachomatis]